VVLRRLGYNAAQVQDILKYIDEKETIEGAPHLKDEHIEIFDCAFPPANGKRSIHYMGHIKMMAAVQPFLSGAISKTVNMPTDSTPEEIAKAYIESWRLGLKAVAVYRDGCKRSQPLSTSMPASTEKKTADAQVVAVPGIGVVEGHPIRRKLPDERQAITHKFSIAGHEGYITVGMYEDGKPGEVFLVMAKEGSTVSGLMDGFATSLSLALQYGVPLEAIVDKFSHTRYEPSGFTKNPDIGYAKSITDYIARWMAVKFLGRTREDSGEAAVIPATTSETPRPVAIAAAVRSPGHPVVPGSGNQTPVAFKVQADAPPCHECGSLMVRNGACYRCANCGATSGCS
jgi:ribonucleoside-diphosphate reductase alpha chain